MDSDERRPERLLMLFTCRCRYSDELFTDNGFPKCPCWFLKQCLGNQSHKNSILGSVLALYMQMFLILLILWAVNCKQKRNSLQMHCNVLDQLDYLPPSPLSGASFIFNHDTFTCCQSITLSL